MKHLTLQEFLDKAQSLFDAFNKKWHNDDNYSCDYQHRLYEGELSVRWETGGVSGGSCWDSSDPEPYSRNLRPMEISTLDDLLSEIKPDINFLEYKKLKAALEIPFDKTDYEYYGNKTDYSGTKINLTDLYNYMKGKDWL